MFLLFLFLVAKQIHAPYGRKASTREASALLPAMPTAAFTGSKSMRTCPKRQKQHTQTHRQPAGHRPKSISLRHGLSSRIDLCKVTYIYGENTTFRGKIILF